MLVIKIGLNGPMTKRVKFQDHTRLGKYYSGGSTGWPEKLEIGPVTAQLKLGLGLSLEII